MARGTGPKAKDRNESVPRPRVLTYGAKLFPFFFLSTCNFATPGPFNCLYKVLCKDLFLEKKENFPVLTLETLWLIKYLDQRIATQEVRKIRKWYVSHISMKFRSTRSGKKKLVWRMKQIGHELVILEEEQRINFNSLYFYLNVYFTILLFSIFCINLKS